MPLATPADSRILLLRAVKFHHFESENDDFPGINTFRPEGNNPEKAVSLYNMSLCSDAEAALAHAQKYHRHSCRSGLAWNSKSCTANAKINV